MDGRVRGQGEEVRGEGAGRGDAGALEARVRAENARGTSAWVVAEGRVRALDERAGEGEGASGEWGAQWGKRTRASDAEDR